MNGRNSLDRFAASCLLLVMFDCGLVSNQVCAAEDFDGFSVRESAAGVTPLGGWDDDAPARRYREGRLVIADFAMAPPEDRENLDAMVATQIRIHFDYRCKYGRKYGGGAEADVMRMDIFAVVRPQESWNATPDNGRLLDHEQGHFDIAQIAATSAKLVMHKKWKAGELVGTARKPDQAIEELRKNIQAEMEPFYEKLKKAQKEYDRLTAHGRRFRAQREQREAQERIRKLLTGRWEDSEWYHRRRSRLPVLADVPDATDRRTSRDENDASESNLSGGRN